MNTIELFCGTKSFSKVAKNKGYNTFTIDIDKKFNPDLCIDVLDLKAEQLPKNIQYMWCSPPCNTFSVASLGYHWNKEGKPKTEKAKEGLLILEKTIKLISEIKPKYWIIENPRGKMRKVIDFYFKKYNLNYNHSTATYCQYEDFRMKPTDFWSNKPINFKKCKNGMPCHEPAPRGSKTGTQGLKNAQSRYYVPPLLIEEFLK